MLFIELYKHTRVERRSLALGGSLGLLLEEGLGLVDALGEQVEVGHEALDLDDGQIDQHAGDLGGVGVADHLGHELEDGRPVESGQKYIQAKQRLTTILNESQFEKLVQTRSGNAAFTFKDGE